MSYISILLPAFYLQNSPEKEEIIKFCNEQFETSSDSFELIDINDNNKSANKNYAIKFKESDLSLNSIEDLIYQRDCIKSICEKTFESLQTMTAKLNDLEKEIKSFNENGSTSEEVKKDLVNDNMKLRDLLASQIEYSDNFRINTEKTLNKIKEEFQTMVQELETMRKKTAKSKPTTQRENLSSSVKKRTTNSNSNHYTNNMNNSNKGSSNKNQYTKVGVTKECSILLHDLLPGGLYYLRLQCENQYGLSNVTPPYQFRTGCLAPDQMEPPILARKPTEKSATIRWSEPTTNGSAILGYHIHIDSINRDYSVSSEARSQVINKLIGNTEYSVTIVAVNSVGQSKPSEALIFKTEAHSVGVPFTSSFNPIHKKDKVIEISWSEADCNGSAIQKYYVGWLI